MTHMTRSAAIAARRLHDPVTRRRARGGGAGAASRRHRRHRLGAHRLGARPDDDAARPRALLRRPGAREERPQRPHAVRPLGRHRRRAVDPRRLQPGLRHRQRVDRRPLEGRARRASTLDSVIANFASPPRNIPEYVFIMFQAMFAIITPALILGAIAERMKFSVWCAFITIWLLVVYCPIAHMVWASEGWIFKAGAIDFAGGLVVHMSSGFSALVAAHHARQAPRLRQGADAAAQPAALPDRRRPAVDRLVRLQRRQRAQREPARGARLPQHQHRRLDGGRGVGADRVAAPRQADGARRRDRRGRRPGRDHAGLRQRRRRWARSRSASASRSSRTRPARS